MCLTLPAFGIDKIFPFLKVQASITWCGVTWWARATILRLLVILIESPLPELNGEYPIKPTPCFSCQGKTSYSTPRSDRLYRSSLAKQSFPPGTLNNSSKSATSKFDTPQWRISPSFCNSLSPRTVSDKRLSPRQWSKYKSK